MQKWQQTILNNIQLAMAAKIYNIELPKWFNDSRTVEQMLVRIVLAVVSYNCVLQ